MLRSTLAAAVAVAGLILCAVAIVQALAARPFELFLIGGVSLAVVGVVGERVLRLKVGPSSIEMTLEQALKVQEQLAAPAQSPDLKLLISTGIPVGSAETMMGTDHIVQVTVVNTSATPLGVNSVGLGLSDGRFIPVFQPLPSAANIRLPAVLQPQQSATTWTDHDGLRGTLRDERVRLKEIIAHLADGSTRREPVPEDWARVGDPGT